MVELDKANLTYSIVYMIILYFLYHLLPSLAAV